MSNIYINEPPTSGKVLLETGAGDIDIELWSKEAPKACRNFIQLCLEGYYDGLIFHRVVRDFIVQGGDPTGTGEGGESIYGKPFKDEFHTRIRFNRRGMVAMANAGPNDNGSQFFFTMGATPELQNKHTIFGKITGNTVFNMLKLQESEVDGSDKPIHPYKINKTQILSNPFDDIIPRVIKKKSDVKTTENKPKSKSKATKNFSLLSFGEEAEEDEEENVQVTKDMKIKSKSSHDLTDDPRLSSKPAVDVQSLEKKITEKRRNNNDDSSDTDDDSEAESEHKPDKKKIKIDHRNKEKNIEKVEMPPKSRSEELKEESKRLQKELKKNKNKDIEKDKEDEEPKHKSKKEDNAALEEYQKQQEKYKEQKQYIGKKGSSREELTLMMLSKFKNKLESVKTVGGDYSDDEEAGEEEDTKKEEEEAADDSDLSWMRHKLQFDEKRNKVMDANVHDSDRYEIYDPRNPMTKRRREASKQKQKDKK